MNIRMDEYIDFFIKVGRLKSTPRPGWVLRGVKNPETVAEHTFRVLMLAWIFGKENNLKIKRLLKLALVHSLSASYIDYISPYDKLLETKSKKELLKKYPALKLRAPIDQKGKIFRTRFKEEKKVIEKLTKTLPEPVRHEIRYLWLDFQQRTSKEARFLKVVDKLENLIQALEYRRQIGKELLAPFLSQVNEVTDNTQILNFARSAQEYFLGGEVRVRNRRNVPFIKFIHEIGKLKVIKRRGWIYGGAKEEETESVASHTFRHALMCWLLVGKRRFDLEKLLKMILIHDLEVVYAGDITPFDDLVTGDLKKDKLILEKWPSRSKKEKERITISRRFKERKAFNELLKDLPVKFKDEVMSLWFEYEEGFSKEGRFVRQVDRIEKLLQAIEYKVKDIYKPELTPYWTQLKILLDDPVLISFVNEIDGSFYGKRRAASKFVDKS